MCAKNYKSLCSKRGGGPNPKVLGHFMCAKNYKSLCSKRGGGPNPKVFGYFLTRLLVEYDTKRAPKYQNKAEFLSFGLSLT